MINSEDLDAAKEAARAVTDLTEAVCGSTSLNEYKQHLVALENVRDAVSQAKHMAKKEKQDWSNEEGELGLILKKIESHHDRVKQAAMDVRFQRPQ